MVSLQNKIKNSMSHFRGQLGKIVSTSILAISLGIGAYGCGQEQVNGCKYDSQCSSGRICVEGECINNENNYDSIINSYDTIDTLTNEVDPCLNSDNFYYEDKDRDGFGDPNTWICEPADGFVKNNTDCDDTNPNLYKPISCTYDGTICGNFQICATTCPISYDAEIPCDKIDNNCNGQIDENKEIQYEKTCSYNKVYWKNECGNLESIVKTCASNENCIDGECICQPECYNKECGDDGCGGTCGECGSQEICNLNKICECVPSCNNKECGSDGCGGECGDENIKCKVESGICKGLNGTKSCEANYKYGECISNFLNPSCLNQECGNDSCGKSCGECGSGQVCAAYGEPNTNYYHKKCIDDGAYLCKYRQTDCENCASSQCNNHNELCLPPCSFHEMPQWCCPPSKPYVGAINKGQGSLTKVICCTTCYDNINFMPSDCILATHVTNHF